VSYEEKPACFYHTISLRNLANDIFFWSLFIDNLVFTKNNDSSWPINISWDRNQFMSSFRDGLAELSDHSVKAEIKFINDEIFGNLPSDYWGKWRIMISIINFKTCKLRIEPSIINSNNIECNCMVLMSRQWTWDSNLLLLIHLQNVNKLLLFNCSDHDCSSSWVTRQKLSGDNSSTPCFSICLLVHFLEVISAFIKFKHYKSARIRANNNKVLVHPWNSKWLYRSYQPKDLLLVYRLQLPIAKSIQLKYLSSGNQQLSCIPIREISCNRAIDGCSRLKRLRVEIHYGINYW